MYVLRKRALRVVLSWLHGIFKTDVINEIKGNKQHQVLQMDVANFIIQFWIQIQIMLQLYIAI